MRVERRGDPGSGWRLRLRDLQCGAEREIRADLVILTGVREQVTITTLCCIYFMQFISMKVPRLPERLAAQFTGPQCHSSQYRHAHLPHYTGRRVLVVGCRCHIICIYISPHISPCPVQPVRGGHRGRAVHHGGQGAGERGAGRGAHQGLLLGEHRAGGRHRQVRAVNEYK